MDTKYMSLGEAYYKLVGEKNVEGVSKYLHPDVEFTGPLATLKGKDAVLKATSHFMDAIQSLAIRAKFGGEEQAMIVYEVDMPGIKKDFAGASMLNFKDGLIVRIQLFYDASLMTKKKEEIFS